MLGLRAGELNFRLAGDLVDDGRFVQNIEHAVARGKGVLQRRTEICQRDRGAERREQRKDRDERPVERQLSALHQRRGRNQHCKVEEQNGRVRDAHVLARETLELGFLFG